jgi:hypothetical protein
MYGEQQFIARFVNNSTISILICRLVRLVLTDSGGPNDVPCQKPLRRVSGPIKSNLVCLVVPNLTG